MALAQMRASSALPSIKCSNCGYEIEISMMGDHTCTTPSVPPQHSLSPPSHPFARPARPASPQSRSRQQTAPTKQTRIAPPRIDPSAANRPYAQRNRLESPSQSRSTSQSSVAPPDGGLQSRRPSTVRSATSPMPRSVFQLPSPELSGLDCAFPPFPSPKFPPNSFPGSPKSTTSSVKAPSLCSEPDSYINSRNGGTGLGLSGAESRKPSFQTGPTLEELRHEEAQKEAYMAEREYNNHGGTMPNRQISRDDARQQTVGRATSRQRSNTVLRPTTPGSLPPVSAIPAPPIPGPNVMMKGREPPPRPTRPDDVDGFLVRLKEDAGQNSARSQPGSDPGSMVSQDRRANTFARGVDPSGFERRPSEPTHQIRRSPSSQTERATTADPSSRAPALVRAETMPTHYQGQSVRVPPRNGSRNGYNPDPRSHGASPMPKSTPGTYPETGMHTPSDSGSSTTSSLSAGGSSARTRPSPPLSAVSSVSALSSTTGPFPKDAGERQLRCDMYSRPHQARTQPIREAQTLEPLLTQASFQPKPQQRPQVQQQQTWTPVARPYAPLASAQTNDTRGFSIPRAHDMNAPESPMDPAYARDIINQAMRRGTTPTQSPQDLPQQKQSDYFATRSAPSQTPIDARPTTSQGPRTAGTVPKHTCRGCSSAIVGKSVKAADGGLTGRYHKECFVCKTCRSPFASGDFYVYDNDPYCEHHYHALNDSLCSGCGSGIEGQYLETQQSRKFHRECLTCLTCRAVLSEDYFEIGGLVYCERHAFAAVRSQGGLGGKRNLERRTTRLMMIWNGGAGCLCAFDVAQRNTAEHVRDEKLRLNELEVFDMAFEIPILQHARLDLYGFSAESRSTTTTTTTIYHEIFITV